MDDGSVTGGWAVTGMVGEGITEGLSGTPFGVGVTVGTGIGDEETGGGNFEGDGVGDAETSIGPSGVSCCMLVTDPFLRMVRMTLVSGAVRVDESIRRQKLLSAVRRKSVRRRGGMSSV